MAKKYLHSIELQNFKAFPDNAEIKFNGRHALVFGVNGSGKSSIFWALYTALQCSSKKPNEHKKYFEKIDPLSQSLRNVYQKDEVDSFVQLNFKEKNSKTFHSFKLSETDDECKDTFIKQVNSSSEFITHRLLLNFSNFRNSEPLNLWPFFWRDIIPFAQSSTGVNLLELYNKILDGLTTEKIATLNKWRTEFNNALEDLIDPLKLKGSTSLVSDYYNDYLARNGEKAVIGVYVESALAEIDKKRQLSQIKIHLTSTFGDANTGLINIGKPHIFFNEARINAIALAIRFVLMEVRKKNNIAGHEDDLNLLVLDDLLISLDLNNRLKVIDLIIDKYSDDYQIIILTHEKGFYNELKRKIHDNISKWQLMVFEPTPIHENPKIRYDRSDLLTKAIDNYKNGDYEACALYLRKETESILGKYTDPELKYIWANTSWTSLGSMIEKVINSTDESALMVDLRRLVSRNDITIEEMEDLKQDLDSNAKYDVSQETKIRRGELKSFRRHWTNFLIKLKNEKSKSEELNELVSQIKVIKNRCLNPGAHFNESPLFKEEIEEAIETVIEIKKLLANQNVKLYIKRCKEAGMNI
ncbi:ATP-binding protein [Pontibacter ramchanderi]|uniref:AAA domain-containing protein n=1 Tax=Pontibacter ramchanderi TaxID=1179743 RepID=A0A2N3V3S1_9BACT|nr:ATP-binding protein [Pontibacter ramchanderi]PKV76267.1 AAA domain-containing protein [Pontibacter ramchanderi]